MNLIPETAYPNGNYLCTWSLQEQTADRLGILGEDGPARQRNALTSALLLDREDLYHPYSRADRAGLYLLLDDGWDVPPDTSSAQGVEPFGSLVLDETKFPGMGDTPAQRLRSLVQRVKELGYAGLGLWISPQEAFGSPELDWTAARAYWEERARWCGEAGVSYWKVDWGRHDGTEGYREMMTECVRQYAPGLLIEHTVPRGPLSGECGEDFIREAQKRFAFNDVYRTYDITSPFDNMETFSRTHVLLQHVHNQAMQLGSKGLVNVEDQPMVAAGLGLNLGVMGFSRETLACLRWQRMAPPEPACAAVYRWSEEQVRDCLTFDYQPVHWIPNWFGKTYALTVPASAARGMELPKVQAEGEKPVVLCSANCKSGACAVSILRRNLEPNAGVACLADIEIHPPKMHAPVAVFGLCRSLTLRFDQPLPEKSHRVGAMHADGRGCGRDLSGTAERKRFAAGRPPTQKAWTRSTGAVRGS